MKKQIYLLSPAIWSFKLLRLIHQVTVWSMAKEA